jgi:hypothetical protein
MPTLLRLAGRRSVREDSRPQRKRRTVFLGSLSLARCRELTRKVKHPFHSGARFWPSRADEGLCAGGRRCLCAKQEAVDVEN